MKTVIMAGGEGQRLRPLTCTVPKPMVRISGKPVIEYIFDLLIRHGITDASVTLGYMPEVIERAYESGYKNLKLEFIRENEPLGTAGSVKNAVGNSKEPVLVISGDAVCDFDLSGILRYHQASSAKVTVVANKVNEPREYGLINVGEHNRIVGFTEKPSWSQAVTNLANTGLYIIEPDVISMIPDGESFDFAKDLFPQLLEDDIPMFCYNAEGYWCDIGSVESYLTCQNDALDSKFLTGKVDLSEQGAFTIIPPVFIGENADISSSAVIGPYACIDNNCYVGDGARIRYSSVLENAFIGRNASVTGALVCSGASVKSEAALYENSVTGAGAVIGEKSTVKPNVKIWPGKIIPNGTSVDTNVKFGNVKQRFLNGEGIAENSGARLSVETCAKLGRAVGSTRNGKRVGIAVDGTKTADAMSKALTAGILSAGGAVWNFGHCFKTQLNFLVNFCELGSGVFLSADNGKEIYICGEGGLSIPRFFERSIESAMQSSDFNEISEEKMKESSDVSSIKQLYEQALMKQAPYGLKGVSVDIVCRDDTIRSTLQKVLKKLGAENGGELILSVDSCGAKLEAVCNGETVDYYKLLALACLDEMKHGRDIAVPYDAPDYLDSIADSCGRTVYRYLSAPADDSDSEARRLASKQFFVRDALFLAVKILSVIKENEQTLPELLDELPKKFIADNVVSISYAPSSLVEIIGEDNVSSGKITEGIKIIRSNGKLLIIPERGGGNVKVLAEADTMEAAHELCIDMSNILISYNNK